MYLFPSVCKSLKISLAFAIKSLSAYDKVHQTNEIFGLKEVKRNKTNKNQRGEGVV